MIWPAPAARVILATLLGELREEPLIHPAQGGWHTTMGAYVFRAGRSHASEDAARGELVREAREHARLEGLLVPGSILVVQRTTDDVWWLWKARPALEPFEPRLSSARSGAAELLVTAFASALARACRACVRHDFTLDMAARSFVVADASVFYAGPILPGEPREELAARIDAALGEAPVDAEGRALLIRRFREGMGEGHATTLSLGALLDRCKVIDA